MVLAPRDLQLLRFIAEREAVPALVLVAAFFLRHPLTGQTNRDPAHACRRRLAELERAGWIVRHGGAHHFVTLSSVGARRLQVEAGRAPALKNAVHHAKTVEAVGRVLDAVGAAAGATVRMENAIRQERIGGRFVKRGDDLDVLPDAELRLPTGERIAVEYVTSKYADEQIKKKALGLAHYDRVFFFADRAGTAQRVMRLTNRECPCI